MTDTPTVGERAAIDRLLGPPESSWEGAPDRSALDGHVAYGGFHRAAADRHLLLPALHAVQDAAGWISPGALNYVCARLGVPPAEAYGVATFYALFSTTPRPPTVVHVCDDLVCRRRGALDLLDGVDVARDGQAGWERSPCLGRCDAAPAAFVQVAGGEAYSVGHLDDATLSAVLAGRPAHRARSMPTIRTNTDPIVLERAGNVDPASLDEYRARGGYRGLISALERGPDVVIAELERSRLRGRGGAAFPIAAKWRGAANAEAESRLVICNADESEPGTFKDRVILETDPFAIVEALTVAGFTVGARRGYCYVRGEYPEAIHRLQTAIAAAADAGWLGDNVGGSGFAFDIEIRRGAGAYICGEETALFNSIEGFRGEPRQKPPYPTEAGLFGRPTVVNNVETLASVPWIMRNGGDAFAEIGTTESTGTKVFAVSGDVAEPGVVEVAFGTTLHEVIELAGGVTGDVAAVLLGGAAGAFVGPEQLDLPLTFEATRSAGVTLGSGAVTVFTAGSDFDDIVARIAAFFRDESCGQCVPCRIGTVRQEEALTRLRAGSDEIALLRDIGRAMTDSSICGLGQTAASAVTTALGLGLIGPRERS